MSTFGALVHNYIESGISVIPIIQKTKQPAIKNTTQYFFRLPTEEEIDDWYKKYTDCGIALMPGPASGIVGFDYDYSFDASRCTTDVQKFQCDKEAMDRDIRAYIPETPLFKFGGKGWTAFYKYSEGNKWDSCLRNGVTFFDFLAPKKYCILPPTIHPSGQPYRWGPADTCLYEVIDDLQSFPQSLVEDVKYKFGDKDSKGQIKKSRHGELLLYAFKIMYDVDSAEELADALVKKDQLLFKNNSYLLDPKYQNTKKTAHENALEWIPRIVSSHNDSLEGGEQFEFGKKPQGKQKAKTKYEHYELFFMKNYPDIKKNIINDEPVYSNHPNWYPVYEKESVQCMKSDALNIGLPKSHVEDHLSAYIRQMEPEFLVDIPKWDGVDRVTELAKYLSISNVSKTCFIETMKEWGANMFRRVEDPSVQNKFIIFRGEQDIGKDYLIKSMMRGLSNYFDEMDINQDPKENAQSMLGLVCANISEFDKTSRVSVSQLKAMITQESKTFRESYGRKAKKHTFKTSFISSCNVDDILRDYTGNRRYAIFVLDHIDRGYDNSASMQFLAQWKVLANERYTASDESKHEMKAYIKSQTPENPDDIILENYLHRLTVKLSQGYYKKDGDNIKRWHALPEYYRFSDLEHIMLDVARYHSKTVRQIQILLSRRNLINRVGGQSRYEIPEKCVVDAQLLDNIKLMNSVKLP